MRTISCRSGGQSNARNADAAGREGADHADAVERAPGDRGEALLDGVDGQFDQSLAQARRGAPEQALGQGAEQCEPDHRADEREQTARPQLRHQGSAYPAQLRRKVGDALGENAKGVARCVQAIPHRPRDGRPFRWIRCRRALSARLRSQPASDRRLVEEVGQGAEVGVIGRVGNQHSAGRLSQVRRWSGLGDRERRH